MPAGTRLAPSALARGEPWPDFPFPVCGDNHIL
jgi:hypothetical protein